jgi:hypothetical protein
MSLNKFSDFMQVLNNISKHNTKKDDFPKHILFISFYLLLD